MNGEAARPTLVMLHGWGLNLAVFDTLVQRLAPQFEVLRLDLPGHGRSTTDVAILEAGIDALAAQLAREITLRTGAAAAPLHLLGWSLGGMLSIALAAAVPQLVQRLTLIASTPSFVARADWRHGLAPAVLDTFATQLRADYHRTVHEFLELQVRGSAQSTTTLHELQAALDAQGAATPRALAAGLELLRNIDLRARVPQLTTPALVISGQYDRVTPPWAGRALAAALPHGEYHEIARAGHAPFLSHTQAVADLIREHAHA